MPTYKYPHPFPLEGGTTLPEVCFDYRTYGTLTDEQDNVVWICHALTGDAAAHEWWSDLVGPGKVLDTRRYFIVCANVLGSCYGSTGASSINPRTGEVYGSNFPAVTIRDMVRGHRLLCEHLGIERIRLGIGGSLGGQQLLEWAVQQPELFEQIVPIATNARHSAWGIAFNTAQQMALESDPTLHQPDHPERGWRGLEAARSIAMLSYRTYDSYENTQGEPDSDKLRDFRAESYQRYQGQKLRERFDVFSYRSLSGAMNSHNLGRGRGGCDLALRSIRARTLVIGIRSDLLFPPSEQVFLASHIPEARLEIIESSYGHDGFLVEGKRLTELLNSFLYDAPLPVRQERFVRAGLPGSELF